MMLLLILKSSACLAVLMLFYKLFLEKTSAHIFKRFYLIGAITISIIIPFITFTTYIEVEPASFIPTSELIEHSSIESKETIQPENYLSTILWCIYALGLILFSFRFFKNLSQLIQKIKTNPNHKNQNFINVLITDLIAPHTFFNYIFLNKTKFENNLIPTEVLLHEQTHAKQKHALDILFIEVLQILFWFNPLLYIIKKDIKLNHEFLADQSVLKQGIDSSTYQNILLAFSSNASHSPLANAINYSLIKKRFTVMNTHTSKRALWLRSLIISPLLAFLIYGFSDKVIVENEVPEKTNIQLSQNSLKGVLIIKIFNNETIYINDIKCDFENMENHIIEIIKDLSPEEKEKLTPITVFNSPDGDKTLAALNNILRKHQLLRRLNLKDLEVTTTDVKSIDNQQKATPEEVSEYNALAIKFKANPEGVFKEKDIKRIITLYNMLTKEQKKTAEKMPSFKRPKPLPDNATPDEIIDYNKRLDNWKELFKDLKIIEIRE